MCVSGLQIPSHGHNYFATGLEQSALKSHIEPPVRKQLRRGLFIHPSPSLIPELQHQLSQIKGAVPKFLLPHIAQHHFLVSLCAANCGRAESSSITVFLPLGIEHICATTLFQQRLNSDAKLCPA